MEALEALEFNLLWHHALRLEMEEAHLAQKTLHNFRVRLMEHDGGRLAFCETTDRMIEALGLRTGKQRLDSTHVMSNIAVLTRLGLFCETVRVFLLAVSREHPGLGEGIGDGLAQRYLKETGEASGYEDARSGEGRRRLSVCTCSWWIGSVGVLERLLGEQQTVVPEPIRCPKVRSLDCNRYAKRGTQCRCYAVERYRHVRAVVRQLQSVGGLSPVGGRAPVDEDDGLVRLTDFDIDVTARSFFLRTRMKMLPSEWRCIKIAFPKNLVHHHAQVVLFIVVDGDEDDPIVGEEVFEQVKSGPHHAQPLFMAL